MIFKYNKFILYKDKKKENKEKIKIVFKFKMI